jgi:hypothetical protein
VVNRTSAVATTYLRSGVLVVPPGVVLDIRTVVIAANDPATHVTTLKMCGLLEAY